MTKILHENDTFSRKLIFYGKFDVQMYAFVCWVCYRKSSFFSMLDWKKIQNRHQPGRGIRTSLQFLERDKLRNMNIMEFFNFPRKCLLSILITRSLTLCCVVYYNGTLHFGQFDLGSKWGNDCLNLTNNLTRNNTSYL